MSNGDGGSQNSRTQVIVALVGLIGTVSVGLFANWDKVFPDKKAQSSPSPVWKLMGTASTGESIYVDTASIKKLSGETEFTYKIGNELVDARADCQGNRWYASKYGWNSPQSPATQEMLGYVCK
jgi:hypothetical protein